MSIEFDYEKDIYEYSEFIEPDYKLEYIKIEKNMLGSKDKIVNQINDFKLPSCDVGSIHDDKIFDSDNISNKNLEEEDLLLSPKPKSTCLLNDAHLNLMDTNNFKFENKFCFEKINSTTEQIQDERHAKLRVVNPVNFEVSENVQGLQSSLKALYPNESKPHSRPNQHEHDTTKNTTIKGKHESSLILRWGRNEDAKLFKTLRKSCTQENIAIETFWNGVSPLTDVHHNILKKIAKQYNWKRSANRMLERIKRLGKEQKMSVRQMKLFRRLEKKAKRAKVPLDFEKVVHMFPGKLVSTLESCMKK